MSTTPGRIRSPALLVGITVINPTELRTEFDSQNGDVPEETLSPDDAAEHEGVATAVDFATEQVRRNVVQEPDFSSRDEFEGW